MDVEIFESAKKNLRIQKYLDTCGRGLNEYKATKLNMHLPEVCSEETNPVFSVSYQHTYRHDNLELKPAQRCMESMGSSFVALETDIIEVFDSLAGNKGRKIKTRMLCVTIRCKAQFCFRFHTFFKIKFAMCFLW